jgi:hypothetical protein
MDDWDLLIQGNKRSRRGQNKYSNLPWVKELNHSQMEELKELVRTEGDIALRGDKTRAGSTRIGNTRAPNMYPEERKALEVLGMSQQQFTIAEPVSYFMTPMTAPAVDGATRELDYPDIPFAAPVNAQALAQQDVLQTTDGAQAEQHGSSDGPETWGARNFKEILPNKFIWQQLHRGYRVTKGAVTSGLKNIARYQNYRWHLIEDEDAVATGSHKSRSTQRAHSKRAAASLAAAADANNYDPELEG